MQNLRNTRAELNVLVENQAKLSFRYNSPLVNFAYQNEDWWLDLHVCFDREYLNLIRNQVEEV